MCIFNPETNSLIFFLAWNYTSFLHIDICMGILTANRINLQHLFSFLYCISFNICLYLLSPLCRLFYNFIIFFLNIFSLCQFFITLKLFTLSELISHILLISSYIYIDTIRNLENTIAIILLSIHELN